MKLQLLIPWAKCWSNIRELNMAYKSGPNTLQYEPSSCLNSNLNAGKKNGFSGNKTGTCVFLFKQNHHSKTQESIFSLSLILLFLFFIDLFCEFSYRIKILIS